MFVPPGVSHTHINDILLVAHTIAALHSYKCQYLQILYTCMHTTFHVHVHDLPSVIREEVESRLELCMCIMPRAKEGVSYTAGSSQTTVASRQVHCCSRVFPAALWLEAQHCRPNASALP